MFGSKQHYHFVHKRSPHLRTRRDTSIHQNLISKEKLVTSIQQQVGYKRAKRGYRTVEDLKKQFPNYETPNDPYFKNQWYLVSFELIKSEIFCNNLYYIKFWFAEKYRPSTWQATSWFECRRSMGYGIHRQKYYYRNNGWWSWLHSSRSYEQFCKYYFKNSLFFFNQFTKLDLNYWLEFCS